MSKHLFGLVVTPHGAAANNRGENEGNITTLQKILWNGELHTTVSAEAIRWAIRYYWQRTGIAVNRVWNDEKSDHEWQDTSWKSWTSPDVTGKEKEGFIDDDVMGFMLAEAANLDGSDVAEGLKKEKKEIDGQLKELSKEEKKSETGKALNKQSKELGNKIKTLSKGTCDKRRGALEISRALSLTPFVGDITFNAKSGEKSNTSLYGTEVHATRYQYGFALTPESLRVSTRLLDVLDAVVSLSEVAGNQSRYLYDFSPDAVVFRWTDDFAPRMLYGFSLDGENRLILPEILGRIEQRDIDPTEVVIGMSTPATLSPETRGLLKEKGVKVLGVKAAAEEIKRRAKGYLKIAEEEK